ncbi:MAG: type II toxin-antitoxin system RelE/ParE family toxin [Terriglobales bacterium]
MTWEVLFHEEFEPEFDALPEVVQDELLAHGRLLQQFGPQLGRPRADTLNGSRHANMKELRFDAADGVWRVAFAFDPNRKAILLVCGDKSGGSEKRFYRQLIEKADSRLDAHLARVKKEKDKQKHKEGK